MRTLKPEKPMIEPPYRAPRQWPLYWFARLDIAIREGDFTLAAEAQRELAKLGVNVAVSPVTYGMAR